MIFFAASVCTSHGGNTTQARLPVTYRLIPVPVRESFSESVGKRYGYDRFAAVISASNHHQSGHGDLLATLAGRGLVAGPTVNQVLGWERESG